MSITAVETGSATTAGVLAVLRGGKADRDAADVVMVRATVDWAVLNEVGADDWYANYGQAIGDRGVPLAGAGAPLVSEFAAMEYAAALGMSTDAGKAYIGRAWSCATDFRGSGTGWSLGSCRCGGPAGSPTRPSPCRRLVPRMWTGIWPRSRVRVRGRRSTDSSRKRWCGSTPKPRKPDAARPPNGGTSTSMSTRSPTTAPSTSMASWTWPTLWILRTRSAPVRHSSQPVGTPSRWTCAARSRPVTWPADSSPSISTPTPTLKPMRAPGRSVVLYAHLGQGPVARCGNTRSPISVEQIQGWCSDATQVIVKPVIDLAERIHVEAYEAPDRLKEQNALVAVHCVFPHCTRPAQRCDTDHVVAYADGGSTSSENTAPLCRRHHRAKTHSLVDLHRPRPGHLPVDHPPRHPAHPRPHRHPPTHRRTLTTKPHTPAESTPAGEFGMTFGGELRGSSNDRPLRLAVPQPAEQTGPGGRRIGG